MFLIAIRLEVLGKIKEPDIRHVNAKIIEQHGFQLVQLIDETSRTVVWKAVQRTLDRTVMLRILKPEAAADPAEVEHFLTTSRKISRIKSDSIVSIFDIVSEKDLHYVALEYIEGPTLEELVAACGPLPIEQVLRIAASLISSLEQMWESSHIVHRNLKSATIRLDPRGVAKITDFSLAIVAGPGVNATAMDGGNIVGTPCFLSPEQAQGSHTLNTQSDMYALGAVLYHLATGIVPFEGQDVVSILSAHVKQQIPPPHHLNKALPISFSWFIHRLMMKNPNNRYANWQEVLQDIRHQLSGNVPSCVQPDEEYLSTIEAILDTEPKGGQKDEAGKTPSNIRLNRKDKDGRITAYQSKNIQDEHASEIRRETLIKELFCWSVLAVWLAALVWFRAVYQADPAHADAALAFPQLSDTVTQLSESFENIRILADESDPTVPPKAPETTAIPPTVPPKAPETTSIPPPAPPTPQEPAPATPPPAPEKPAVMAAAPETAAPLPAGIPASLATGLAQAFAKGDLPAARQLVKAEGSRFQEKEALATLLEQMPEPDTLIADYLQTQIGKPLIFEHDGKQRTIIPRGVENGVIHIEANGRGLEYAIDKLTADEKLRWMDRPKDEPSTAAYCLILMRSSRHAELQARAAGCALLAPVLIEAADLVTKNAAATP